MRRLLYVLVAMLLLGSAETASACSWGGPGPPPTDADLFAKASTVFVAHIVRTEEAEMVYPHGAKGPGVEGTFALIEVLKGRPPADDKVRGPIPVMCMMPLLVGHDYVIFLNEGDNFIVWVLDRGTRPLPYEPKWKLDERPAHDPHCMRRRCVLGKLRELSKNGQ